MPPYHSFPSVRSVRLLRITERAEYNLLLTYEVLTTTQTFSIPDSAPITSFFVHSSGSLLICNFISFTTRLTVLPSFTSLRVASGPFLLSKWFNFLFSLFCPCVNYAGCSSAFERTQALNISPCKRSISNNPSAGEFVWPGAWLTADGRTGGQSTIARM